MTAPGRCGGAALAAMWRVAAALLAAATLAACSPPDAPRKPAVEVSKAFDDVFGALPLIPVEGPAFATVVYFPAADDSGNCVPAPIFLTDADKASFLTVRTAVRGIDQEEFARGVAMPYPKGTDLVSFRQGRGKATIRLGGTFRAGAVSKKEMLRAAGALALTVRQFGSVAALEIEDAAGEVVFSGTPPSARVADPGNPRVLGLLAIRDGERKPATALSVLFDRPVFVQEIGFFPPGGGSAYAGKSYATGFGMSVEFHPEPGITFPPGDAYRIRFNVRDGKGRTTQEELRRVPKEVVRG